MEIAKANKFLKLTTFAEYFIAALLAIIGFAVICNAWNIDFYVPINYGGDSNFISMTVKAIMDNGWFITNPFIGAPLGSNLAQFPLAEGVFFLGAKFLGLFIKHYAIVFNILYVLTFPFAALSALFVFKRLGLFYPLALTASLLFALLPYHIIVSQRGMFLASYYVVPLAILLSILVAENNVFSNNKLVSQHNKHWRWIIYTLICFIIGSEGVYYAFFSAFFITTAALIGAWQKKTALPILAAILFVSLITLSMSINILPSFSYAVHHGVNPEVPIRSPQEAEIYGLKITQLLLPVADEPTEYSQQLREKYNLSAPLVDENASSSLGLFASMGFLILLCSLILGRQNLENKTINLFSRLTISAILLATIGGFGSLFSYTFIPWIRGYNRVSVFIAFFSLYTLFFLIQLGLEKNNWIKNKSITWLLSGVLLIVGLSTQTNSSFVIPNPMHGKIDFDNDRHFIQKIESAMPKGSMIFQLPYSSFPEAGTVHHMMDYDHLKAYLHSHHLYWSYGSMRGSIADHWQKSVSEQPIPAMINSLIYAGFRGIYIDRNGYQDHGADIESQITQLLNEKPFTDASSRLSFYNLQNYAVRLNTSESPAEWQSHLEAAKDQFKYFAKWGKGCSFLEGNSISNGRACGKKAELTVFNYFNKPIRLSLYFVLFPFYPKETSLSIEGLDVHKKIHLNATGTLFYETIEIPPGSHTLAVKLHPDHTPPYVMRTQIFKIANFKFERV